VIGGCGAGLLFDGFVRWFASSRSPRVLWVGMVGGVRFGAEVRVMFQRARSGLINCIVWRRGMWRVSQRARTITSSDMKMWVSLSLLKNLVKFRQKRCWSSFILVVFIACFSSIITVPPAHSDGEPHKISKFNDIILSIASKDFDEITIRISKFELSEFDSFEMESQINARHFENSWSKLDAAVSWTNDCTVSISAHIQIPVLHVNSSQSIIAAPLNTDQSNALLLYELITFAQYATFADIVKRNDCEISILKTIQLYMQLQRTLSSIPFLYNYGYEPYFERATTQD
jgi:hypothetical protein